MKTSVINQKWKWLALGFFCGWISPLGAATFNWSGGASDGEWNTTGNWQGGVAPNATDADVHLLTGTSGGTLNFGSATSVQYLTFDSGSGAFTLQGNDLSIQGPGQNYNAGLTNASSNLQTINNNIKILSPLAIKNNGGGLVINGNINLNGQSITFQNNNTSTAAALVVNGVISGAAQVNFDGNANGKVILNGTNTWTGAGSIFSSTVLLGGNVAPSVNGPLGNAASISMGAGSASTTPTLLTNGAYTVSRSISIRSYASGATTATIGGNTADVSTFSGTINMGDASAAAQSLKVTAASGGRVNVSGNLARASGATGSGDTLTKIGSGVVALSGTNTYSGATTVSTGTLLINGTNSGAGAISVSNGATLGGNGSVASAITLVAGSKFSAGDMNSSFVSQAGTFTGTDFTWNSSGSADVYFDLGTTSDLLTLSGAFTKGTGSTFTFNFSDAGGISTGTYTLINFGSKTFTSSSDFAYTTSISGFAGNFILNSGNLQFQVTAVPEPSTFVLLLVGAGLVLGLRANNLRSKI